MPFTFAHPAAVLWCARWHASAPFSAFVIGSMSPDFEYFIRLNMLSFYSHAALGIVTFCLPVGLLIYAVFQCVVAPALYRNLPRYFRERLPETPRNGGLLRRAVLISVAIMLGAATHIVWDGFTHGNGPFVLQWSGLEARAFGFPAYKVRFILFEGTPVAKTGLLESAMSL